jgi:tetratricopeptide (TPR) repeat protein
LEHSTMNLRILLCGTLFFACMQADDARAQGTDICGAPSGDADAIIEACTRSLQRDFEAWSRRSAAALSLRAWAWREKGKTDDALRSYSEAIRMDPTFGLAFEGRGNVYRESGQCAKAMPDYDEALKRDPQRAQNYLGRAICAITLSQSDRAIPDLENAVKLDSKNTEGIAIQALGIKAHIETSRSNYKAAAAYLEQAIRLEPKRAGLYLGRGSALEKMGDSRGAHADFEKAIELDRSNAAGAAAAAWMMKARIKAAQGDFDRAILDMDEVIRYEPQSAVHHLARGRMWNSKGDFQRALDDHNRALVLNPNDSAIYISRGDLYQSQNDNSHAINDYSEAIARDPKSLAAYGNRALVYFFERDFTKAADDFKRVSDVQPSTYTSLLLYISRMRSKSRYAKAEFASLTSKTPTDVWPYPMVELYLGRANVQATAARAKNAEEKCEASFYIAHWHLLNGEQPQALQQMQSAASNCTKNTMEHQGAATELKKLR